MRRRLFLGGVAGLAGTAGLLPSGPSRADEFVAYFGYGEAILDANGYRMARRAATYARDRRVEVIRIVAHLDTLEGHEFSNELGLRRSQAVASEMVMLGVAPDLISLETRGSMALARPTADNVAEPLNRRATVDIRHRSARSR